MRLIAFLCVLFAGSVSATDYSFTIGAGSGAEADFTYINQGATATNYGTNTSAWLSDSIGGASNACLLVRWSTLIDTLKRSGAPWYIKSMKIGLYALTASIDRPTYGAFKAAMTRRNTGTSTQWTETGATWIDYKALGSWSTAGARSIANDIDTTVTVDFNWSTVTYDNDTVWFDVTTLGQRMDGADTTNCRKGIMFYFPWYGSYQQWDGLVVQYASDDNATTGRRPRLKVTYTDQVWPPASSTPPRRRRDDMSYLDKIRIYSFTNKGALQCVE